MEAAQWKYKHGYNKHVELLAKSSRRRLSRVFMIVSAFILFGIGELLFFDLRDKQDSSVGFSLCLTSSFYHRTVKS